MVPVEVWKVDVVLRYLQARFPDHEIREMPRGEQNAMLFEVLEKRGPFGRERRQLSHQLLITRQFFDRFTDRSALVEELRSADVVKSMRDGRDRTVELH